MKFSLWSAIVMPKLSVFLFLSLFFMSFAQAFEQWDGANRPELFEMDYQKSFKRLPLKGTLSKRPWSNDYWGTFKGGVSYRWAMETKNEVVKIGYQLTDMSKLSPEQIAYLSPAEKYDLFLGNKNYSLTNYERKRTKILNTIPGTPNYSPDFKIPEWEGICHAWAPASFIYENPSPVTLIGKLGHKIPFGSSDIKALLSIHGHVNSKYASSKKFLGSRCSLEFAPLFEKFKAGLMSEKDLIRATESKECKDTNAGAFHVALANQIGLRNEGFVMDRTRDFEVWNQPIYSYKVLTTKVLPTISPSAAPGTKKEVLVETEVTYIAEVAPRWDNAFTDEELVVELYKYILELDWKGNIIGGEWESLERPDFIWKEQVPPFMGYFKELETIYKKATR